MNVFKILVDGFDFLNLEFETRELAEAYFEANKSRLFKICQYTVTIVEDR